MSGPLSQGIVKRWSNLFGAVVAVLILASVAWIVWPRPRLLPASVVVHEPAHSGDVVRVVLPFANRTWRTIRLTGFTRSCGCTNAVDESDKPIHYPVVVEPGEQFSAILHVYTAGRSAGVFSVAAGYQTDDARYPVVHSQINIDLRAGWCPSATVVRFNHEQQSGNSSSIIVGDTYPGMGVEVDSVRSTSRRFKARCDPYKVRPGVDVAIPNWTPRYCVTVEDLGGDSSAGPDPYLWIYRKDGKDPMRLAIVAPPAVAIPSEPIVVFVPSLGDSETCSRLVRLPGLAEMESIALADTPIKTSVEEVLRNEGDALVRLRFRGPLAGSSTATALKLRGSTRNAERTVELTINVADELNPRVGICN